MYIAATPARLTSISHAMDNIISGTIITARGEHRFRTRGHVIHAVNRIYRNVDWKASAGESILVDGDLGDSLIIDHLEPLPLTYSPLTGQLEEYAERIVEAMSKGPTLATTHRKSIAHDDIIHIRWNKAIKLKNSKGYLEDAILHGRLAEGVIELAAAMKSGGQHLPLDRASQILQVIAPSIGIPYLNLKPAPKPVAKTTERRACKKYKHWSPLPDERPTTTHPALAALNKPKTPAIGEIFDDVPF